MAEDEPAKKRLYLTAGANEPIKLQFNKQDYLIAISLGANKIAELFDNRLVDQKSIFAVEEVVLITMARHRTLVRVDGRRIIAKGMKKEKQVKIDKEKTKSKNKAKVDNDNGFGFDFIVAEGQKIHRFEIHRPHNRKR